MPSSPLYLAVRRGSHALSAAIATTLLLLLTSTSWSAASRFGAYQYLAPIPGSTMVSPLNNIVIRDGRNLDRRSVAGADLTVAGSISGLHPGRLVLSDDGRTLVFNPDRPFAPGERVTVTMLRAPRAIEAGTLAPLAFEFSVAKVNPTTQEEMSLEDEFGSEAQTPIPASTEAVAPLEETQADLPPGYPPVTVLVSNNPDPGLVFCTPARNTPPASTVHMMILDNDGMPLFYRRTSSRPVDFKKLPDGRLVYFEIGKRAAYVMDGNYAIVDSFKAGNGYSSDSHDTIVLPNNHALVMIHDPQPVDMSLVVPGGNPNATVIGLVLQEIDEAKNVVWQWRSWDHIPITDMSTACASLTDATVDYVHGNAFEVDFDGNLLVSGRYLNEIFKINRQTGEVMWRFGRNAKGNQFTIMNDPFGFSDQHDVRRLPNGHITMFDNHFCIDPKITRVLEYELDEQNRIATLVWEYRHTPDQQAVSGGGYQRRDNGGGMIGWANVTTPPHMTDLHPDGSTAWEVQFWAPPVRSLTYRAFRFPWRGTAFVTNVESLEFGTVTVGDSAVQPLVVTNNLSSPITFTSFVTLDSGFSVTDAPPISVPAGGSVTVQAKFRPSHTGNVRSTLYVRSTTATQLIACAVAVRGSGCLQTPVSLDLNPNTLNLKSMGHWVKATLEPEPPASPADIDIASIRLNGSVPVDPSAPTSIGDDDQDGVPDLMVKFDRAAVELAVQEGESVPVTVTGEIGSGCFEATDLIRVIRGHVTAPTASTVLQGGTCDVRWDTPGGVHLESVAVLFSANDGANWDLVANQLPNTGSYVWTVPGAGTDQARIAVVLVESADPTGFEVEGVVGISDRFVITAPLAVGDANLGLALYGAVPNPSHGLNVSFSLASAKPATLAVFDVAGRQVGVRQVGSLGAGRHMVSMGAAGTLPAGVYLVHLVQGSHQYIARAVVVQ